MTMRRGIVAVCWLLVVLAPWMGVRAQVPESPHVRVLGPREGLPTSAVNALDRDRAGFIWIATSDGLARYDGSGFHTWRHQAGDPRTLTGNWVQTVHVDARDRVWVSSEFGGLSMLDGRREGFRHWRRETHPALGSDDIFAIASRGDTLWFGTGDAGLYQMSLAGEPSRWQPQRVEGLPSDTVINLDIDESGRLWIATFGGLAVFEHGKVRSEPLPGENPMPAVYSVLADGRRVWVGTSTGIFRREADGRWLRLPYADMFERPNAATSLARGRDRVLWIGSQRQLWRVASDDAIPEPVATDPAYQPGSVPAILRQPDGGLWMSLPGLGLGYLRSDWRSIAQLRKSVDGSGLLGSSYRFVTPARAGGLWMAAVDSYIERVDDGRVVERIGEDIRQRLPASKPMTMLEDERGQLWIFYGRTGLWRIGRDGRLDNWQPGAGADDLQDGQYEFLASAGDGTLWAGIPDVGLEQRDIASGKVLQRIDAAAAGITDGDIEAMQIGPDGRLWLAGSSGLGWLDPARGKVVVPAGLAGTRVFAFDFGGRDDLWLYRLDGLSRHHRGDGSWPQQARVSAAQGLPSLQAGGLRVDARGRVWLTSQRGLYRWDPRRRHLDHVGIQHGLTNQEFADRVIGLAANGMLGVVARDGSVVLVDTRYPDPPARVPALRIDGIDVRRNGEWLSQPPSGALSFGPQDREFRLTAHLLAFDDPAGSRYWSRLDGFDGGWVEQGAQGERVFSGLGPGQYRLRMRATDAAGNAAKEQVLDFAVRPPWWRTWPALLAAGVLLLALLALLARDYRRRLNRSHALALAEQQRALAEQASEAKTRFLATLGHEIRTPMTGVLGMAELLQASKLDPRQQGQVHAIHRAGKHLLRLVNDALDLARIEAGKLVLAEEPFDLDLLVEEAAALMAPLAERKQLRFGLQRAPGLARDFLGDRTRIEQILLNLLGNAIKFTEQGEVGLAVAPLEGGGVRFVIHDTGPGLNEEQRQRLFRRFEQAEGARTSARYGGSGLGLAISQELAAAMGGRIDVESAPGAGARFSVDLPLQTAPAAPAAGTPTSAADWSGQALSLLLVEDDLTVAEVVAGLLRMQGHAVRHAPHGLAALAEAASMRFDAALLDLDLPGMDGFALARQLRSDGFDGPLLAVTARADTEAEPMARQAGFDAFLRKPVTAEMLASGLRQAAARRSQANA